MLSADQHSLIDAILAGRPTDLIIPGGELTSAEALSIYRESYFARMTESLGEEFESIWWVLGDEDFFKVCREYIAAHPSRVDNLQHYGERFGEFLGKHPLSREFPFLKELADFESKIKSLFHSLGHETLRPETLTDLTEEEFSLVRLKLGSGVRLYESAFGLHAIWRHRKNPDKDQLTIEWNRPERGVIYLKEHRVHIMTLDPIDYLALKLLQEGAPVSVVTEKIQTPERIGPFFERLFTEGWLESTTSSVSRS